MKLLLELRDEDVREKPKSGMLKKREATRAVAMKDNKLALMHVSRNGYHKLPGGGIEHGESIEAALFREMLEETGCKIKIVSEVGKIIEHRTHISELQTSYCFIANINAIGKSNLDEGEIKAGYMLEWATIDQAIKTLEKEMQDGRREASVTAKEKLENYIGKFIIKRDLAFL